MRKGQGRTMHARTKTRGVLIAALATLLSLLGAGTASAVVPGGLVPGQLRLQRDAQRRCVTAHDFGIAVARSPSRRTGRTSTSRGPTCLGGTSLLTFDRNPATGQLTQKDGLDGCFRTAARAPGRALPQLRRRHDAERPTSTSRSRPDGSSVYVANAGNSTILEFDRSAGRRARPEGRCAVRRQRRHRDRARTLARWPLRSGWPSPATAGSCTPPPRARASPGSRSAGAARSRNSRAPAASRAACIRPAPTTATTARACARARRASPLEPGSAVCCTRRPTAGSRWR